MSDASTIHATDDNRFWISPDSVLWYNNLVVLNNQLKAENMTLRAELFELRKETAAAAEGLKQRLTELVNSTEAAP